ncbi:MAG TPA: N,N-dimethylformamidase beta subunit family domain-containing protein [Candidatus Baltobacteraceae bacterium]|nr:N,N-dimethylformamidase beta subunit family domain-containing protein [Candidatus Baltobacteraceae bacterium]
MLRAFPAEPTVDAGGTLTLHVATDAPRYSLRLERWGGGCVPVAEFGPFCGVDAAPGAVDVPWDWPAVTLALPPDLRSGAYVVRALVDEAYRAPKGPREGTPDARWGTALVVVRAPSRARVLVNLPLFTYHAYDVAHVDGTLGEGEGECLYSGPRTVTLLRPGGGTGGHPWDEINVDVYDRASPRQTFAHWDLHALDWLAREGVDVDLCTDLDLQRDPSLLDRYAMLCSFGHDEYWTRERRRAVERWVEGGGALAVFGGNTCWFRVRYDERTRTIARDGKWSDDEPEDAFTGLSFRHGGGKWIGFRPATGYRIERDHALLRAAGLRTGDLVGEATTAIGYECDGVDRRFAPQNTEVLARASIGHWDVSDGSGDVAPGSHAAMIVYRRGEGAVFNAGTADWARALAQGDAGISAITRAVFASFTPRR